MSYILIFNWFSFLTTKANSIYANLSSEIKEQIIALIELADYKKKISLATGQC